MSKNYTEISTFIWNICDDLLRGSFKIHEYGDVILPFTLLRRIDCVLEANKAHMLKIYQKHKISEDSAQDSVKDIKQKILKKTGERFCNVSGYDLKSLSTLPISIRYEKFNAYLLGFSDNVRELMEHFQLEQTVKKLNQYQQLSKLIEKCANIDLHPNKISNRDMGLLFEELLRKFSEMSNETSGEHYTPRDVVRLLVALVLTPDKKKLEQELNRSIHIFDSCCGTGGMLTLAREYIHENINKHLNIRLVGQELNPQAYAMCKSEMLLTGVGTEHIYLGSSLSQDHLKDSQFDYMITNPPFGVSWNLEKDFIETEAKDSLGRFSAGTPRRSDGSLLFLQHLISKMKPYNQQKKKGGSRIGIVFNASPLFTGESGSGESQIRRWIIEQDWLECVVALPTRLFFNTGISTFLWILTNKKTPKRKGKIQLIYGGHLGTPLRKNLGNKRYEISRIHRKELITLYKNFEENQYSKIHFNEDFGYTKVVIEQPKLDSKKGVVMDKKGRIQADVKKRKYEYIPLSEDVDTYFEKEIKPHSPDAWIDKSKNRVGYAINFSKYFYNYTPLRSMEAIRTDLMNLEKQTTQLMQEVLRE